MALDAVNCADLVVKGPCVAHRWIMLKPKNINSSLSQLSSVDRGRRGRWVYSARYHVPYTSVVLATLTAITYMVRPGTERVKGTMQGLLN